jgi:mRNA-degrading endonuclease RelE of RelBE toxin-antitoxin system
MSYRIRYAAETQEHLASLTARQRSTVLEGITRQLREQPLVESRNRKRMRRPSLATWELRLGDLRVFYMLTFRKRPYGYLPSE